MKVTKNKAARTLGELGERGFIKKILSLGGDSFVIPPGDDAVVLKNPARSILSIDGLTEGTHFKMSWRDQCQRRGGFSLGRA